MNDFNERFRPTAEQVEFASKYASEAGLDFVFVAVNFPGKEYGIWLDGQKREPVMDGDQPVIWTDRSVAMTALNTGGYGNAIFRVYDDGVVGAVIELI